MKKNEGNKEKLSAGQLVKNCLFAVGELFRNSPLYETLFVILDEPSSALDPISEYNFNKNMAEAAKDRTVIFISHRLSTTRLADRIIVLEDGAVREEGSHEELLEKHGAYYDMWHAQADKYEL